MTAVRMYRLVIASDDEGGVAVVINKLLTLSNDARSRRRATRIFSAS
jgi:hypothetical protein